MKNLFYLLLFVSISIKAQTLKSLQTEAKAYQQCLDKGENMKGCAQDYYTLADNHLNTVYKKLVAKLSANKKQALKQEQRKWLKERDTEFAKIQREANEVFDCGYLCQDYLMTVANNKAELVLVRVKVLIQRLEELK
jgi:uncharacterized protein YecT (DUF1311 family)